MGNMLENTVECTCEEFVAEIAGERRKPYLDALKSTFRTIVLGKSTLVKEMSSFLRENEGRLERKRVQSHRQGSLGQRRGHRAEDAFASRGHPDPGVEGPNTLHRRETEDEGAPAAGPADARPADGSVYRL